MSEKKREFVPVMRPEMDVVPERANKDTRTWCKGKEGREHEGEWLQHGNGRWSYRIFTCRLCGKTLEYEFREPEMYAEVRRIRKEVGMTQEQLAHKSGIPQETISAIETGWARYGSEVKLSTYRRIFKALGYRVVTLIVGDAKLETGPEEKQ